MKQFKSVSEAQKYAANSINKYSREIATVKGKPSFLCST